jgi:hypothetical protein
MNSDHFSTSLFHEEQSILSNWRIRIRFPVLVLVLLVLIYGNYQQLVLNKAFIKNSTSDTKLLVIDVFAGAIFAGFSWQLLVANLITDVSKEGITVKYIPFHRTSRFYAWDTIQSVIVRQYRPLREYGGWGLQGTEKNRALSACGDMGLQLVFKNGNKLLIGTQKPDELLAILTSLGH